MSLHRFLARLIWLCMLPLVLLAAYLAVDRVRTLQAENDLEAQNLASNFATAIDQNLIARIGALQILVASPHADVPADWNQLYQEAQTYHDNFGSHVILADLEMRMLFNTRAPFGTTLPALPVPKGRAAAPAAMQTGKPAVSDIVFGPVANAPLIAIAVPGMRNGKVAFLMLATFETRLLQARLERMALPSGWSIALHDGNGEVIARRAPPGVNSVPDVDAHGRFVVKSEVSPWSVVLEIPHTAFHAPLIKAAMGLAITILGATFVGALGGQIASRRLGSEVASLVATPAPGAAPPVITEIAAVRRLLDESTRNREAADAERRTGEEKLRAFYDLGLVGLAITSPAKGWIRVNHCLCQMLEYSEEELRKTTWAQLTHPDDLAADLQHFDRLLAGEIDGYSLEKRFIGRSGKVISTQLVVRCARNATGEIGYVIAMIEDITTRKQAEEALRELNAELEQRVEQRTAELTASNIELDSFAYSVSHDLRAPLRSIDGFARVLEEDYADRLDDEGRDALKRVRGAAQRMGELTDDLLKLSRLTRIDMNVETVDLSAIARAIADRLKTAEPGRNVAFDIPPNLEVRSDSRLLSVLLENLLGNAWKFTGKHARARIEIGVTQKDGEPAYFVRDDGAGFDMAHAANLFAPFQRLHSIRDFPGTGIGLATVRRIVQRHGGRVWAEGAVDKGATFYFTLSG